MGRLRNPFNKKQESLRNPQFNNVEEEQLTFRRSRTLTGSSSESVRTASESRAQLKSPRLKEHELRTHRRKLGGYLVVVIAVVGLLGALLSQFVGVVSMNVQSNQPLVQTADTSRYKQLVDEYFASRPVERFRFAFDDTAFAAYLADKAPEVARITLTPNGLITATGDISFRVPVVVWQLQNERSYVDSEGHSFTLNYFTEPAVTVKDDSGLETTSGAIVSDRFLRFMGRVIALTDASGAVRITGATLPRGYSREIDFSLEGRGYIVKTQLDRDPASQAADIINAVKYFDSKGMKPAYVDVRIPGKAAYR